MATDIICRIDELGRVAAYANAMGYDLNKMIGYEG